MYYELTEDPLPQKTRRSFPKASIPLEKGDKCRKETPVGAACCAEGRPAKQGSHYESGSKLSPNGLEIG